MIKGSRALNLDFVSSWKCFIIVTTFHRLDRSVWNNFLIPTMLDLLCNGKKKVWTFSQTSLFDCVDYGTLNIFTSIYECVEKKQTINLRNELQPCKNKDRRKTYYAYEKWSTLAKRRLATNHSNCSTFMSRNSFTELAKKLNDHLKFNQYGSRTYRKFSTSYRKPFGYRLLRLESIGIICYCQYSRRIILFLL